MVSGSYSNYSRKFAFRNRWLVVTDAAEYDCLEQCKGGD